MIGAVGLLMTACSSTYKIKSEKGNVMNTVPKWYMADYSESKACDTPWLGKDKDKMCIFGVATAVSPDLQLAIEKGKMLAKSELADIIAGKMNKESKQFITELGKTNTKTVVSEVESVLVILYDVSSEDAWGYVQSTLDFMQDIVYSMKESG